MHIAKLFAASASVIVEWGTRHPQNLRVAPGRPLHGDEAKDKQDHSTNNAVQQVGSLHLWYSHRLVDAWNALLGGPLAAWLVAFIQPLAPGANPGIQA